MYSYTNVLTCTWGPVMGERVVRLPTHVHLTGDAIICASLCLFEQLHAYMHSDSYRDRKHVDRQTSRSRQIDT